MRCRTHVSPEDFIKRRGHCTGCEVHALQSEEPDARKNLHNADTLNYFLGSVCQILFSVGMFTRWPYQWPIQYNLARLYYLKHQQVQDLLISHHGNSRTHPNSPAPYHYSTCIYFQKVVCDIEWILWMLDKYFRWNMFELISCIC